MTNIVDMPTQVFPRRKRTVSPGAPQAAPAWTRPQMPFEDIVSGARSGGGFNPGGAFGTGKNTIPSMQRWNRLAPSEQEMQVGIWQDDLGVYAPDVLNLMNKLRPTTARSFAPRWMM